MKHYHWMCHHAVLKNWVSTCHQTKCHWMQHHQTRCLRIECHIIKYFWIDFHQTRCHSMKHQQTRSLRTKCHRTCLKKAKETLSKSHWTRFLSTNCHWTRCQKTKYHKTRCQKTKYHQTRCQKTKYHQTRWQKTKYHQTRCQKLKYHQTWCLRSKSVTQQGLLEQNVIKQGVRTKCHQTRCKDQMSLYKVSKDGMSSNKVSWLHSCNVAGGKCDHWKSECIFPFRTQKVGLGQKFVSFFLSFAVINFPASSVSQLD